MIDRIGPFEVIKELGRGGMGIVYLARDTRLDRQVAIKALPEHLASDPVRLERFEREAKTLAGLSHVNVAGIYGVEEQEGARYLVLEFVEGETLADIIDRGPLVMDDAIEYAAQIAAGLEAAHEAGVIHRDLKPANIKITPDGVAKVLDFGLARTAEATSSSGALDNPTLTTPQPQHSPTIEGAILGTAAYMSPEQARGRRVDTRTDIWSFGIVLYEMLVGASPFQGETATDSIGAILHKDLDLDRLPPDTPRDVRRLISRCLHRDRTARLQSIGDARIELQEAADPSNRDEPLVALSSSSARTWQMIAGALLLALVAGGVWALQRAPNIEPPLRPDIASIAQVLDSMQIVSEPSISPDGRTVVFSAQDGADYDIYSIRVGGSNPVNLTPNSDGDEKHPAVSPDGEYIAYTSSRDPGGIFIMGATGENPRRITDSGFDPEWSPDGTKLVYTSEDVFSPYGRITMASLFVVDVESRDVTRLQITPSGSSETAEIDAVDPSWSPDGRWIAYWGVDHGTRNLFVVPAEGGEQISVTNDRWTEWNPIWGPHSDRLYFVSDRLGTRDVWVVRMDSASGQPIGEPEYVLAGPARVHAVDFSSSGDRLLLFSFSPYTKLERVEFDSKRIEFLSAPKKIYDAHEEIIQLNVSHDGQWIAYRSDSPKEEIIVMRIDGSERRQITNDDFRDRGPVWSPREDSLIFYSNRDGPYEIWRMSRDGANLEKLVTETQTRGGLTQPSLDPTGAILAVASREELGNRSLLFDISPEGDITQRDYVIENFFSNAWSPGGDWIVGEAFDTGFAWTCSVYNVASNEIFPIAFADTEAPVKDMGEVAWLDEHRFIFWSDERMALAVADARTQEVHVHEGDYTDEMHVFPIRESPDAIILTREYDTAMWLLELEPTADE